MNTPSDAVSRSAVDSQSAAPGVSTRTRPLFWSIHRELWENRSIYLAPLIVSGVVVLGFVIGGFTLPRRMHAAMALDPAKQGQAIATPYEFAAGALMLTQILVGVFYALDALYGERRDRSIFFWKSLPVSDWTAVLAKATIPIFVVPLLTFAITVGTQWIMLLLSAAFLQGSGLSVGELWTRLQFFDRSMMLLYHLVTVHGLSHAPVYGWLLLVSAWARRAPLLWALLPPLAIGFVEKIAFNTTHFAHVIGERLAGGAEAVPMGPGRFPIDPGMHVTPGRFLASPGLWFGLFLTALFLAGAVRLRRERGPI